uniref:BED-type domain-containing protein n=1 Tax=Parascaris univalens TaxID=6257 RepID=A0A915BFB3_PARUN
MTARVEVACDTRVLAAFIFIACRYFCVRMSRFRKFYISSMSQCVHSYVCARIYLFLWMKIALHL